MSEHNGQQSHFEVLIVGGGTGGLTVAAQLRAAPDPPEVAVLEPSDKHYYQPLWTLVGGGVFPKEESERDEADFIPAGVTWIRDGAAAFRPAANTVETRDGRTLTYDHLVVAMGLQINWDAIPGLEEGLRDPDSPVASNYAYDTCEKTWNLIRNFTGGTAVFTEPVTGVKCGGAPQKIMYLAEDYFRKQGIRDRAEVIFCNGKGSIFSSPWYGEALTEIVAERDIEVRFHTNLVELRPGSREAVVVDTQTEQTATITYAMIHVTPPMGSLDVLAAGPLAGDAGWVDVDPKSLQHVRYANVFALGDCSSLPTSKTGAAIRKQAPTLVENLLAVRAGHPVHAEYDGYTSCPLVTGYGRLILAEFDYTKEPKESFPFDQRRERYSMYALKAYMLPRMYWHGMLKGRL